MASWSLYKDLVGQLEGLYQANPNDFDGNYNSLGELVGTMRGISALVYEAWIGRPPTVADMKSISLATADAILKKLYWDLLKAPQIKNQEVAEVIVDHGINSGTGSIAIIVQRVLNNSFNKNLAVDGGIGNLTLSAINSVNQVMLHSAIIQGRKDYYLSIKHKKNNYLFYDGWIKRLDTFIEAGENMLLTYKKPIGLGFMTVATVATILYLLTRNSDD